MPHARSIAPFVASLAFALACDAASSGSAASGETKTASAAPAGSEAKSAKAEPTAAPELEHRSRRRISGV